MTDPGAREFLEAPIPPALPRPAFRAMLVLSWSLSQISPVAAEAEGALP
jgi:hypothetical protein